MNPYFLPYPEINLKEIIEVKVTILPKKKTQEKISATLAQVQSSQVTRKAQITKEKNYKLYSIKIKILLLKKSQENEKIILRLGENTHNACI